VLIGPRFGEDAAVVDIGAAELLVLKSDPVTYTEHEAGWYVVHVNANDIAVMGGRPRWFQPTIILPEGSESSAVLVIARDIDRAARALGIAVTGGHTEVSAAVRQPIVAGDMQGLVARDELTRSSGARPGDVLVMTKSAGIEGTSILALEYARVVRRLLGSEAQRRAANFHRRPGISIVADARIAVRFRASALHDPTEGGVAMGLVEMASGSRCRFEVDVDKIPVHPWTRRLCDHFGIRALGLLGSGALLAALPAARAAALQASFRRARIPAQVIGRAVRGTGIEARSNGRRVPFVWSERDELAQLYQRRPEKLELTAAPRKPARSGHWR
jgi:hydrogenase maturation factor